MWRSGIWRQEGTKVISMQTGKGLRELELKSKLLPEGQLLLSMFDVTDSLRAEEALRASEVKFRSIFYDSGVGMALVDKTGNIFDAGRLEGFEDRKIKRAAHPAPGGVARGESRREEGQTARGRRDAGQ